jgi:lipoprotein-anchoring transpeptidase ErfK/SrfK
MLQIISYLRIIGVLLLGYWLGTIRPRYNYQEVPGTIIFTDSSQGYYMVEVAEDVYTVNTSLPLPDSGKSIIILTPL